MRSWYARQNRRNRFTGWRHPYRSSDLGGTMPKGNYERGVTPNKVTHFNDRISVIALECRYGSVWPCYLDTVDYPLVAQYRWCVHTRRGAPVYAVTGRRRRSSLGIHQLLMPLTDGRTPDHIDRNGLNNRRNNLRPATQREQLANRSCQSRLGSGVEFYPKKKKHYRARIRKNGRLRSLGYFTTAEEAARVVTAIQDGGQ